jgi:hypothetical protein
MGEAVVWTLLFLVVLAGCLGILLLSGDSDDDWDDDLFD